MMDNAIKHLARVGLILLLTLMVASCAPRVTTKEDTAKPIAPKRIVNIVVGKEDLESCDVRVKGSDVLTFTSVKQPFPLGVILYFPDTVIDIPEQAIASDSDTIGSIQVSSVSGPSAPTARVEIPLKRDIPYTVIRDGNDIRISLMKPEPAAAAEPSQKSVSEKTLQQTASDISAPTANVLKEVTTGVLEEGIEVSIKADGTIKDYNAFTIETPPRIVFDLFNLKSPPKTEKQIPVDSKWLRQVRYYGYPDRLRIVLDTPKAYLKSYTADSVEDGLRIRITSGGVPALETPAAAEAVPKEETPAVSTPTEAVSRAAIKKPPPTPEAPARVNRIDFESGPGGKSTIVIGTTRAVKYDLEKISEKRLQLRLSKTTLPEHRRRPLITTRFNSAVNRITPHQRAVQKDTAWVSIELRESVPYLVEQSGTLLQIRFEASTVPPRSFEAAQLPAWEKAVEEKPVETPQAVTTEKKAGAAKTPPAAEPTAALPGAPKKYTGEKIALDFYETDIKNVLRILREVSGKNFAIDKDVAGKVTLSLDTPVPWDQVLDLVLRMNQLDTVMEGDIIRVATSATLQNERALQRSDTTLALEAEAQEKALEPLITEYISVNYANAEADVRPHIVLTPDRGGITVDSRNNQLIITDTAEMIKRARETVLRIDQVTPQVLIEARVVEASSSFSRDLGTQLSVTAGPIFTRELGNGIIPEGTADVSMAANNPPSATPLGEVGINFSKLTGTPFSLSATLLASESEGQIRIISAPRVLTLDNKTATIKQGTEVPIPRLDDSGNTVIEFKEVNLELNVTPHVTPDKRISMEITVTNNDLGPIINNEQAFTTKEAVTELLVNDGETVVIGGIRKTRRDSGEAGVPGLKDVPVVSWLFKNQSRAEDLEELLIFITPKIVQLQQRTKS